MNFTKEYQDILFNKSISLCKNIKQQIAELEKDIQDLKNSNEFKLLKSEFKDTIWESTIDRFHIQDVKTKNELLNFILKI